MDGRDRDLQRQALHGSGLGLAVRSRTRLVTRTPGVTKARNEASACCSRTRRLASSKFGGWGVSSTRTKRLRPAPVRQRIHHHHAVGSVGRISARIRRLPIPTTPRTPRSVLLRPGSTRARDAQEAVSPNSSIREGGSGMNVSEVLVTGARARSEAGLWNGCARPDGKREPSAAADARARCAGTC